jgi:hypothetical protein
VNEDEQSPRSTVIERHAQTIIVAILLALLLGTGGTLLGIRDDVTRLNVKMTNVETQLQNAGDDRFRGADWRREREIIEQRFNRIEVLLEKHTEDYNRRNGK